MLYLKFGMGGGGKSDEEKGLWGKACGKGTGESGAWRGLWVKGYRDGTGLWGEQRPDAGRAGL